MRDAVPLVTNRRLKFSRAKEIRLNNNASFTSVRASRTLFLPILFPNKAKKVILALRGNGKIMKRGAQLELFTRLRSGTFRGNSFQFFLNYRLDVGALEREERKRERKRDTY